jgi:hypothetical protein
MNRLQKTGTKNVTSISPIEAEIADRLGAPKAIQRWGPRPSGVCVSRTPQTLPHVVTI